MKVLLVAPREKHGFSGGQAKAGRIVADGLHECGSRELILYHVVHPQRAELEGYSHALWLRAVFYFEFFWVLARHRPDVVHVFSPCSVAAIVEKTALSVVGRACGARTLINLRNDPKPFYDNLNSFQRTLIRCCLSLYSGAICQYKALTRFFSDEIRIPQNRVYVVHNAICGDPIAPSASLIAKRMTARRLIFLGSLQPRKGIDILLKAVSFIEPLERPWLDIVGDAEVGSYVSELADLAGRLGIGSTTVFHGAKFGAEKTLLINSALGLVLPSRAEGFPNVLLEAAQLGLPAIYTRVGAYEDILVAYGDGVMLVNVDEVSDITAAILHLMAKSEDYNARTAAALRGVKQFGVDSMCRDLIACYSSILKSSSAA